VALCRHSVGFELAPLKNGAGIQSFQSRGTRDWTPGFAGVTGRENVIIFGNCYKCRRVDFSIVGLVAFVIFAGEAMEVTE
jgi:hypothetical protein